MYIVYTNSMAGILTHIIYAEKVRPRDGDFIVGASLADIDYLGVIERSKTHVDKDTYLHNPQGELNRLHNELTENASKSLFDGLIFHSLTEHLWAKGIWVDSDSKYFSKALKLWGDEILWDKLIDSAFISKAFAKYENKQLLKGVDMEAQRKWFKVLDIYLTQKSSKSFREKLANMIDMPKLVIDSINITIENELVNNEGVKEQLLKNLESSNSISIDSLIPQAQ